jgi:hypothetical protein
MVNFDEYKDPFRAFNTHMAIICDLEQGGKIDEQEAFTRIKSLYKEFKKYYKLEIKVKDESEL